MRRTNYTTHNHSSDRSERSRTGAGIDTPDTPKALNDVSNTSRSVVLDDGVSKLFRYTPNSYRTFEGAERRTGSLKWKAS